jgi:hypothetical protein
MENTLFYSSITPPKGIAYVTSFAVIIFIVILLPIVIGLFIGVTHTLKNTSIAVRGHEIVVKSFLYGRHIPMESVMADEIRVVNLDRDSEYQVSWRTNGIRLPGFLSGWVRLKSGKKALAFITDKNNVLMVPTKDFVLLFSLENSAEFIEKIKEAR